MNIWIVNHSATPPRYGSLVRHYYFSRELKKLGHTVRILTSSQIHNTPINKVGDSRYLEEEIDGVIYTFVRSVGYTKNNWRRIANMGLLPQQMRRVFQELWKQGDRPDVILASSPTPFACQAAQRFAQKKGIPFVMEVRDLWPQSIVEYGHWSSKHPLIQALYRIEHNLYRNADALIFTMAGGADYIRDRGWSDVKPQKVHQVNNGVDLPEFLERAEIPYTDADIDREGRIHVVYCGSVRAIYALDTILDLAKYTESRLPQVDFLIYGDGPERKRLEQRVEQEKISNCVFKSRIEKEKIPGMLKKADIALLHHRAVALAQYGLSPNKLFEYGAAGCPILSTVKSGYSLIEKYEAGIEVPSQDVPTIYHALETLVGRGEETRQRMGRGAYRLAEAHDFSMLAKKLEQILEQATKQDR